MTIEEHYEMAARYFTKVYRYLSVSKNDKCETGYLATNMMELDRVIMRINIDTDSKEERYITMFFFLGGLYTSIRCKLNSKNKKSSLPNKLYVYTDNNTRIPIKCNSDLTDRFGTIADGDYILSTPNAITSRKIRFSYFIQAINYMTINDTIYDLIHQYAELAKIPSYRYLHDTAAHKRYEDSADFVLDKMHISTMVKDFITRVETPTFEKDIDSYIDIIHFIRVYIDFVYGLSPIYSTYEKKYNFVKKHAKDFIKVAVAKIKSTIKLNNLKLSIEYFKVSEYVVTRQNQVMILFERFK